MNGIFQTLIRSFEQVQKSSISGGLSPDMLNVAIQAIEHVDASKRVETAPLTFFDAETDEKI